MATKLGAADAERDVRGAALKACTEDGNWDLVGRRIIPNTIGEKHGRKD